VIPLGGAKNEFYRVEEIFVPKNAAICLVMLGLQPLTAAVVCVEVIVVQLLMNPFLTRESFFLSQNSDPDVISKEF
jgi:hypothetical protein